MKLSVDSLTTGLQFHGEVAGKRQRYYVLSGPRRYFVMSLSTRKRDSGNFNLVSRSAVDRLHRRLRGRSGLTAKLVFTRSRNRRLVPSHLAALNMLYVLVATGRASIDQRRLSSRELFFNVKSQRGVAASLDARRPPGRSLRVPRPRRTAGTGR